MTESKESIENYKQAIERLAKSNSELLFDNSGVQHAAIVLSTIFNHSNNTVRIYANDMNGEISSQPCYKDALNDYLNKGGKLKVILDDSNNVSDTIQSIISNNNVELKLSNAKFKLDLSKASKDGKLYHFAVGDEKMIRIELDGNSHKAVCSFNLPGTSSFLINFFDNNFSKLDSAS